MNREDAEGNNLFEGGFLGLDNIGPIDRSHLPPGTVLEQSDATGWMAFYAVAMAGIAAVLNRSHRRPANDLVMKFLEHFAAITEAMEGQGLWDDTDGLYYDRLLVPDGSQTPVQVRSMVAMIPALAVAVVDQTTLDRSLTVGKHFADFLDKQGLSNREKLAELGVLRGQAGRTRSRPTGYKRASTTSLPSPLPPCSAGTPTGGGRSGCRSTTWWSAPWSVITGSSATS